MTPMQPELYFVGELLGQSFHKKMSEKMVKKKHKPKLVTGL